MTPRTPLRVVGVGSPHGDDALAWEVIARLRGLVHSPAVEFHTIDGGHRLLEILDGRGTLVLIDAMSGGGVPGQVRRCPWPDPRLEILRRGLTHTLSPTEALVLAESLGLLPSRVEIWGMEGGRFTPETGLSESVAGALPGLVQEIRERLLAAI